jgi:hypothetical protein
MAITAVDSTRDDKRFALVFALIAVANLIAVIFHSIKNL